jgi:hypothetical protein
MEYPLADWDEIGVQFSTMFSGLGKVEVTENHLSFTSNAPLVTTGILLTKEGALIASMPLHAIDSCFERAVFGEGLESIRLIGPMFDYTYSIPSEILALRNTD